MLPAAARLTRRDEFASAVKRGRRAGRSTLVAHLAPPDGTRSGVRAGFVVSRAVGGAVVRHRVQRRLRHLVRDRLALIPDGGLLVVRALPPAAAASSEVLGRDLDAALAAVSSTRRRGAR